MWLDGAELSWPTTFIYPSNAQAPVRESLALVFGLDGQSREKFYGILLSVTSLGKEALLCRGGRLDACARGSLSEP